VYVGVWLEETVSTRDDINSLRILNGLPLISFLLLDFFLHCLYMYFVGLLLCISLARRKSPPLRDRVALPWKKQTLLTSKHSDFHVEEKCVRARRKDP